MKLPRISCLTGKVSESLLNLVLRVTTQAMLAKRGRGHPLLLLLLFFQDGADQPAEAVHARFPLRTIEIRNTREPADEPFRSGAVQIGPPDAAVQSSHDCIERTAFDVTIELWQLRLEFFDTRSVSDHVDERVGSPL